MVDGNGLVTGMSKGTATITVRTYNGKKATIKIKVVDVPAAMTDALESTENSTGATESGEEMNAGAQPPPAPAEADAVAGAAEPTDAEHLPADTHPEETRPE